MISLHLNAQTPPQFPTRDGVVLTPVVDMSFGDFTIPLSSSGGTVTVDTYGSRTPGNDVILLSMGTPVRAAMFEFKLCPGRSIKIIYPDRIYIDKSSGSGSKMEVINLSFRIDGENFYEYGPNYFRFTSNKGCNEIHRIYVGGVLKVSDLLSNPAGPYRSNLSLIIEQQ